MLIAIDFETHLTTEHDRLPKPVCMSVCAEDGHENLIVGLGPMRDAVRALASGPHTVIAHNGAWFDFPIILKWFGADFYRLLSTNRARCTLLWSQLVDFAVGRNYKRAYGLAHIAKRLWGADIAKDETTWRLRYAELEHTPLAQWPADATAYVMNDSRICLAIAKTLRDVPDVARKTRQFVWLSLSSARGAYTSTERAAEWRTGLETDCAALVPPLEAAGILRPDGTRDIGAIRRRIAAGGTILRNAPTASDIRACALFGLVPLGAVKADKEACQLSTDPIVKLYALYVDRQDKLAKEVLTVERGLIHTRYHLVESGRTSSSDPPLQNIGTKSPGRRCFMARTGLRYVVTDFSQLELSCVSQLCVVMGCGDTMARAIREHRPGQPDVHDRLAMQIDPTVDPKSIRRLAKEGQFGRLGGMGAETLKKTAHKRGVEITIEMAKKIIVAHRKTWPEISGYQETSYHSAVKRELDRTGGVLEHYRSGRLRGGLSFTQGANTLFQGLGSEVMLDSFVALGEAGLLPVLEVHDEFHHEVSSDAEVKTIGDICQAVGADWLPHAPPKAVPEIVQDWSQKK